MHVYMHAATPVVREDCAQHMHMYYTYAHTCMCACMQPHRSSGKIVRSMAANGFASVMTTYGWARSG